MLKQAEKTFKALGDKNRLRIIKMLQRKPMCVCEIREVLGLAQPTVSKHLKILKEAGIVEAFQKELWTDYRLTGDDRFAKSLLKLIEGRANEDTIIKKDRLIAGKADRRKICACKRGKSKC
jgi:ArsR family transcriptional regulator, arsenate/arsenite/antimonite-responsive transcriptional repressor